MKTTDPEFIASLRQGDTFRYGTSMYEVATLVHPTQGPESCLLRQISSGHFGPVHTPFAYEKTVFKHDFKEVYVRGQDRELALLASLMLQANVSGDIGEIHELLLKVEI